MLSIETANALRGHIFLLGVDSVNDMLRREMTKVHGELLFLRDEFLPVILSVPLASSIPDHVPDFVRRLSAESAQRLSKWQEAITQLADTLPPSRNSSQPSVEQFSDFMFSKPTFGATVSNDGIHWEISICIAVDFGEQTMWMPLFPKLDTQSERRKWFRRNTEFIVESLTEMSVLDSLLMNSLCVVVPMLADDHPTTAIMLLDPETWNTLAARKSDVSEEERDKMLADIEFGYFPHVLNNALLHLFAALANNHFLRIGECLDHPCMYGSYTGLIPHYLFAILFQKVCKLYELCELSEEWKSRGTTIRHGHVGPNQTAEVAK